MSDLPPLRAHTGRPAGVAGALLLGWALLLALAEPASGQPPPGVFRPYNQAEEILNQADSYYNMGRRSRDATTSRYNLRAAVPLYREYLRSGAAAGETAQRAAHQLGMSLLLTGQLQEAETLFKNIINRYKTGHWVAWSAYRLAAQLYNRKEWRDAAPYFGVAVREATDASLRHKSLYYEARCLELAGRGDEAIARLEAILSDPKNPFHASARIAIGKLHAAAGRHEEALATFERLFTPDTSPDERAQALLAAGVSASRLGRVEQAEAYLSQTIDTIGVDHKFKARAQLALMDMYFRKEDYETTVKVFRRGEYVGENEIMAQVYMVGGKALAKLGRHNEAIRQFFNAERLSPLTDFAFEASYRRLSSFYQIDGPNIPMQVDAFLEVYAERHPGSPWLHKARLMKAEILFSQGSFGRAALAYADITASRLPEEMRADVYFKRGWCLAEIENYNLAAQNLSQFVSNYPEHPQLYSALAQRGTCYLQLGDRSSARLDFERILAGEIDQDLGAYAEQQRGRIYREDRNFPKMIEAYTSLLENYPNLTRGTIANANYWIGWAWFELEEWSNCIPFLERARNLQPRYYQEPAGTHLALAAYSLHDAARLKQGVLALLQTDTNRRLPPRMLTWLGLELFRKRDYEGSDRFLTLASTPENPELTDTIVWRHLAKARLEIRHFKRALETLEILLKCEQSDFWRADTWLDRTHAFIGTSMWDEARESAHEGLQLQPEGTVRAGLYMSLGDIAMQRHDYQSAAASYLRTSEMFVNDNEIKPLALHRAAEAYEKNLQPTEAARIRRQLTAEFPDWSAAPDQASSGSGTGSSPPPVAPRN